MESLHTVCYGLPYPLREKLRYISKSGQLEVVISHLKCENMILHIVEGGGLNPKIRPYVDEFTSWRWEEREREEEREC